MWSSQEVSKNKNKEKKNRKKNKQPTKHKTTLVSNLLVLFSETLTSIFLMMPNTEIDTENVLKKIWK